MRTDQEYKNLEAERDALAARVVEMRGWVTVAKSINEWDGMPPGIHAAIDSIFSILATPDDSAAILARHDAAIWLEAAEVCEKIGDAPWADVECPTPHDCSEALRARAAAELEKAQ